MWCRRQLAFSLMALGVLLPDASKATLTLCFSGSEDLIRRDYDVEPGSWLQWSGEEPVPIVGSISLQQVDHCSYSDNGWFASIQSFAIAGGDFDLVFPPTPGSLFGVSWSGQGSVYGSPWPTLGQGAYADFEISVEPLGDTDGRIRKTFFDRTLGGQGSIGWDGSGLPASFDFELSIWTSSFLCHYSNPYFTSCEPEGDAEWIGAMRLAATVPESGTHALAAAAFAALRALEVIRHRRASGRSRDGRTA